MHALARFHSGYHRDLQSADAANYRSRERDNNGVQVNYRDRSINSYNQCRLAVPLTSNSFPLSLID